MTQFIAREGRVSEAERAEAKAMLERHFGDFERFRRSLPKEQPAKIRKTIPMWFADKSKPVDFVALLNETLKRFGYAPAGRQAVEDLNVYGFRADWSSSEVSHFPRVSFTRPAQPVYRRCGQPRASAGGGVRQRNLAALPPRELSRDLRAETRLGVRAQLRSRRSGRLAEVDVSTAPR